VNTQDESRWKSVNVNANGKVFQVYTIKCKEIATEINKRRQGYTNSGDKIQHTDNHKKRQLQDINENLSLCGNCGNKSTKSAAFCGNCGNAI